MNTAALNWLTSCLRDEHPHWPDEQLHPSIADQIWQTGQTHGVLALCSYKLSNTPGWKTLPAAFQERLRAHTRQAAAVELLQEVELKQVLKMLNREGINPLLMKGTPLAYSIYPQPYLRSRCDTDLLFPDEASAVKAWLLLQKKGYKRSTSVVNGRFISYEFTCFKSGQLAVQHNLDFHWKLSNTPLFVKTFSFNDLLAVYVPVPSLGKNALAFNPEYALLHACMHRFCHKPFGEADRLVWLYDIHLLIGSLNQAQWDRFMSLAVEKKICNICLDGLQVTASALATPVPSNVKNILLRNGKKENITAKTGTTRWRMDLAILQSLPGWRERLVLLKEHFFPNTEYMLMKYRTNNRLLLPFLYSLRALQGIGKRFR